MGNQHNTFKPFPTLSAYSVSCYLFTYLQPSTAQPITTTTFSFSTPTPLRLKPQNQPLQPSFHHHPYFISNQTPPLLHSQHQHIQGCTHGPISLPSNPYLSATPAADRRLVAAFTCVRNPAHATTTSNHHPSSTKPQSTSLLIPLSFIFSPLFIPTEFTDPPP